MRNTAVRAGSLPVKMADRLGGLGQIKSDLPDHLRIHHLGREEGGMGTREEGPRAWNESTTFQND